MEPNHQFFLCSFEFIGKKLRGRGNAPPESADPLKKGFKKFNDFIKSPKKSSSEERMAFFFNGFEEIRPYRGGSR